MKKRRIVSVTVLNEHSVLSRIAGLFAGRGYNIESLTVAPLQGDELSRITIATSGDERVFEQIIKQLHKLIPVLSVIEDEDLIQKETALAKVSINESISDINALCKAYNGGIANANDKYIILTITDSPQRVDSFIKALKHFKPKEVIRSGVIAIEKH